MLFQLLWSKIFVLAVERLYRQEKHNFIYGMEEIRKRIFLASRKVKYFRLNMVIFLGQTYVVQCILQMRVPFVFFRLYGFRG